MLEYFVVFIGGCRHEAHFAWFVGVSALLIAAPLSAANAADMEVKAPPAPTPAAVVAAHWTGLYLDADIGWQRNSYTWNTNDATALNFNSTFSLSNSEGSIGGHIGYEEQFNWLVVGGEVGTFTSITQKFASLTSPGTGPGLPCGLAFPGQQCQANVDNVYTFGGKVGVDWSDWLFYGVGGGAEGAIRSQINLVGPALAPGLADTTPAQRAHGWYAGGGFDYMLRVWTHNLVQYSAATRAAAARKFRASLS